MKLGFYPGCSLEGSSREYNESVQAVARASGISLEAVPDWNCCGSTAAHNLNHDLALALPARILALAETAEMKEMVVPCAACYSRLAVTRHELKENEELRARVVKLIDMELKLDVEIINVLQMLERYVVPVLSEKIKQPFAHRVVCYYGCLLVRPHQILKFDRAEEPQSMDEMVRRIGGTPLDWAFKVECCGAGLSVSKTDMVGKLSGAIIADAAARGAEAVIVACPMCHYNLDSRRPVINKRLGKRHDLPALYITQAVGLAMGLDRKQLGLHRHMVPVRLPEAAAAKEV